MWLPEWLPPTAARVRVCSLSPTFPPQRRLQGAVIAGRTKTKARCRPCCADMSLQYMRHDSLKRAARRFSDLLRERPALQGRVSLDTFLFTATAVSSRLVVALQLSIEVSLLLHGRQTLGGRRRPQRSGVGGATPVDTER